MDIADVAQASLKMCFKLFQNPNLSTVSTASYLTPDCLFFFYMLRNSLQIFLPSSLGCDAGACQK
jgi:hypothetical protein